MTTHERALQIYQVLIGAARNRQVLTYEIVGKLIGVPRQGLARHLGHIMHYCEKNKLPPLTALVVGKISGKPGEGLITVNDLSKDMERIFNHEWYAMMPLTVDDLKKGDLSKFNKAFDRFSQKYGGKNGMPTWEEFKEKYDKYGPEGIRHHL
jgi:alkylated DNA nucleotide flippase Atl1